MPLAPEGVLLRGSAMRHWVGRFLKRGAPAQLRGVGIRDGLVALGPAESLGWAPEALFFGREQASDLVYLPCGLAPSLPVAWLQSLLSRRGAAPWLLLPDNSSVGLSQLGPIGPDTLWKLYASSGS
jgi:hypothetical protein